jgi:hypothetical protein
MFLDGIVLRPLCLCGCGQLTNWQRKTKSWARYMWHHRPTGIRHSPETRAKISAGRKNYYKTHRNYWLGRKHSADAKKKISLSKLGRKLSPDHCRKLSEVRKGIQFSDEHKLRISHALTGMKRTPEWIEKQRVSLLTGGKLRHGAQCPSWRGGVSFLPYGSDWTKQLKRSIKTRDNHQCQNPKCVSLFSSLVVHHVDYDKCNNNPTNLITLCVNCHSQTTAHNVAQWIMYYQAIMRLKEQQNDISAGANIFDGKREKRSAG